MRREDNVQIHFQETEHYPHGNRYLVSVAIPMDVGWIDDTVLVLEDGGSTQRIPMHFEKGKDGRAVFTCDIFLDTRAVYRYFFEYSAGGKKHFINRRNTKSTIAYDEKNKMSVNFEVPEWAKGAVMYHIFVDRFYHSPTREMKPMPRREIHQNWNEPVVIGDNERVPKHFVGEQVWNVDFYGGNLKGIEEKLDYIQSLGVTILYLSPIVSSQSTHRYDAADYEKVDPYVGMNQDLKDLCEAAHKRGMKVVLDAVFNHVGDESKYFDRYEEIGNGAFRHPDSYWRDFFHYSNQGDFCYWFNFKTLPKLNCEGQKWRNYICGEGGIIDQWFSLGIDGIRLDVADELTDQALEAIHDAVIRNKKDGFILGEVWKNVMRTGKSYISSGRSMHSTMDYILTDALVRYFKYHESNRLDYTLKDIQAEYPKGTIDTAMNFTSTHDMSRPLTLLATKEFDGYHQFDKLDTDLKNKIIESLWEIGFSNELVASLLRGDSEIDYSAYQRMIQRLRDKGVPEPTISYLMNILSYSPFCPKDWAKDLPEDVEKNLPYTRAFKLTPEELEKAKKRYEAYCFFLAAYPGIFSIFYGDEAGMQGLNNLLNRGPFPWGKEDPEILSFMRQIGQFRKDHPSLREADWQLVDLTPTFVAYERLGDEDMLVAINNSEMPREIIVPSQYRDKEKVLTLRNSNSRVLYPYGGVILKK